MNTIPWYQSAIVRQQIVMALLGLFGLFKLKTDIDVDATVGALLAAVAVLVPVWTIITRMFKPAPNMTQAAVAKEVELVAKGVIPPSPTGKQGGFARVGALALLLTVSALFMACVTSNPYRYASSLLDRAHVTLRLLEEAQTVALPVVNSAEVPEAMKVSIRTGSRAATLAAEQLGKAVIEVEAARKVLATAPDGDARLRIANARLVEWIQTVKDRIKAIKVATKEARAS